MKRILSVLFTLLFALAAHAQVEVSDFYLAETDLAAREERDVDGELYSIIKIRTESPNLNLNEIDAEAWSQLKGKTVKKERNNHVVEIWVYVRYGETGLKLFYRNSTKEIKFNNLQPGTKIGKGEVYIMQLRSMNDTDEPVQQYVTIKVTPVNAIVNLDGEPLMVEDGMASKRLTIGKKYTYTVECKDYYPQTGTVTVSKEKTQVNVVLKPAFGKIEIGGSGIAVYLDKENKGKAPLTIDRVPSGQHTVQLIKPNYKTWTGTVTVRDGEITTLNQELEPNFATVTLVADEGVEIWANGSRIGTGTVTAELEAGMVSVETRKTGHRPAQTSFSVEAKQKRTINLDMPIPICGSANITSKPQDADVYIDDRKVGTTPWFEQRLLVGRHTVKICKEGYNTETKEITVEEGKCSDLSVTLSVGREITITANLKGADIYIDGKLAGKAPLRTVMEYGTHKVSAVSGSQSAEPKDIYVQKRGGVDRMHLELKKESFASYASAGYKFVVFDVGMTKEIDELLSCGLTLGAVKKRGFFVNANTNFNFKGLTYCDYEYSSDIINVVSPYYTDSYYSSASAFAGYMTNLGEATALRLGLGYEIRNLVYEMYTGELIKDMDESTQGFSFLAGLQVNFRGLVLSYDIVAPSNGTVWVKMGIGYGLKNRKR